MGLALLSALFIAFTRNVLYAAFGLIFTFLGVAGVFMMMGASFIAISQILVYVGGILVLIVFGIMLTNRLKGQPVITQVYNKVLAVILSAGFLVILYKAIIQTNFAALGWIRNANPEPSNLEVFGMKLMTDYVLAFEVIGLLLLLALVGAVKMAGKGKEEKHAN